MGQHGQGDMPVPALPFPHFILVQPYLPLGLLKALLDGPTNTATLTSSSRLVSAGPKQTYQASSSGRAMLRRASSQYPLPGSFRGRIATLVQS